MYWTTHFLLKILTYLLESFFRFHKAQISFFKKEIWWKKLIIFLLGSPYEAIKYDDFYYPQYFFFNCLVKKKLETCNIIYFSSSVRWKWTIYVESHIFNNKLQKVIHETKELESTHTQEHIYKIRHRWKQTNTVR